MAVTLALTFLASTAGCAAGVGAPSSTAEPVIAGRGQSVAAAQPQATADSLDVVLPEIPAIELPSKEMKEIAPDRSPFKDLLESATANGLRVTHDRVSPVGIGATQVTWTAWLGEPGASAVRARRRAWVYVFPHGQTPIGVSRDDHATGGNNSPKVVRDGSGSIHAAWLDSGRPGTKPRVMYRRGIQHPVTGVVEIEDVIVDGLLGAW